MTALRWAGILRALGHRVRVKRAYAGEPYDLLVALHARRSYASVTRFHHDYPARPLVVALTGTDLYQDLPRSRKARQSLELATRIVTLQPQAREELPSRVSGKVRVIYQSFSPTPGRLRDRPAIGSARRFDVCVIGHLRPVKDPFRAALAARRLPQSSRVRVLHLGGAMTNEMARRARAEMRANPRYRWLGEQPRWRVQRMLAGSAVCVLSSKLEGGANVLSEAIVTGTPVLASRIPGSVGILGADYPGYFAVRDTQRLAELLSRVERDEGFLAELKSRCKRIAPRFDPRREKIAWRRLLGELGRRRW